MDAESLPPVRFRAIVEMSFPDADRLDPTDYDRLMDQWRKALEDSPIFNCKEVVIIEFLTIGRPEDEGYAKDYEKWRHQDVSHVPPGIRVTRTPVMDTAREPRMNRHCTHCGGQLNYKGHKEIHEGNPAHLLMGRMACDVYVCNNCDHVEFFYPRDPL
jgi:hypothetical protein